MDAEYKPIGSDTVKVYGFSFGMYRYQVEHFDHNHAEKPKDEDKLICLDYWDSIHGTRIYRFLDWDYNNAIHSTIFLDSYLEEDEIKKWILNDTIDWKFEDPYDFKDLFLSHKASLFDKITLNKLFPQDKEHVNHNYPVCEPPYEKCPICEGELDDSVLEVENAADIFNSKGGYGYEGEPWGVWDEIHRCPHCEKLFCVEAEA